MMEFDLSTFSNEQLQAELTRRRVARQEAQEARDLIDSTIPLLNRADDGLSQKGLEEKQALIDLIERINNIHNKLNEDLGRLVLATAEKATLASTQLVKTTRGDLMLMLWGSKGSGVPCYLVANELYYLLDKVPDQLNRSGATLFYKCDLTTGEMTCRSWPHSYGIETRELPEDLARIELALTAR